MAFTQILYPSSFKCSPSPVNSLRSTFVPFSVNSGDAFIYGGAITLELESYITDRIVLLANVRERVLWGGSLGKFSTQFGLGVKFIIN